MATGRLAEWLGSLRVRLAAAMVMLLLAALGLSAMLDEMGAQLAGASRAWLPALQREPYQDGVVLATFGLAVGGLIWAVSAWSLAPLSRASREAALAGPANPHIRISAANLPTEIRPLVAAVNGALDRLEQAYEAERQFTADAAHELRTPLSVLVLRLAQARSRQTAREPGTPGGSTPDWDGIDQDVRAMTRLVAQLLDLTRKQASGLVAPADLPCVNLSRVAREAAASILPLAEAAGRALELDLPDAIGVRGDADDLRDMLRNLLENALLHGRGTIVLAGRRVGARCVLDVADAGAGVPALLRQAVFERFRKVMPGGPGTGLGLAIVRTVARRHGGDAAFLPGVGCVVRLCLPASAADRG